MSCDSPLGINGQTVEMDDGKSGYVGSKVDLRCRFINSSPPVKISQVFSHPPNMKYIKISKANTVHTQNPSSKYKVDDIKQPTMNQVS